MSADCAGNGTELPKEGKAYEQADASQASSGLAGAASTEDDVPGTGKVPEPGAACEGSSFSGLPSVWSSLSSNNVTSMFTCP
eukprot:CAMPEP_0178444876 /NCGR_PEP_ID=MMETSP0689_2-20121128/39810_1 /TAXON_ID=160604 /ORGANISM="Amphidinium massartii, Strain CS-259" /LENGTH=81 /DNA_ID=CAMNT_0020069275 /DNA_START=40 /DNA_END=281 /DNA_ORIENTATION=-